MPQAGSIPAASTNSYQKQNINSGDTQAVQSLNSYIESGAEAETGSVNCCTQREPNKNTVLDKRGNVPVWWFVAGEPAAQVAGGDDQQRPAREVCDPELRQPRDAPPVLGAAAGPDIQSAVVSRTDHTLAVRREQGRRHRMRGIPEIVHVRIPVAVVRVCEAHQFRACVRIV
jgi:hypothetical protein